jgi:hypothetical protein
MLIISFMTEFYRLQTTDSHVTGPNQAIAEIGLAGNPLHPPVDVKIMSICLIHSRSDIVCSSDTAMHCMHFTASNLCWVSIQVYSAVSWPSPICYPHFDIDA